MPCAQRVLESGDEGDFDWACSSASVDGNNDSKSQTDLKS